MTKKDYVIVAKALAAARRVHENDPALLAAVIEATMNLSMEFAAENPKFDRARFYAAVMEDKR